jgi:Tfp pilus assembly protein PilV
MKRIRPGQGLTLIETLIALSIFVISFLAIMLVYKISFSVNWQAQEKAAATNLIRQTFEGLKQYDGEGFARNVAPWTTVNGQTTQTINGVTYTVTTQVIALTSQTSASGTGDSFYANNSFIPVRVTVTWSSHNLSNSVVMETCYYQQ